MIKNTNLLKPSASLVTIILFIVLTSCAQHTPKPSASASDPMPNSSQAQSASPADRDAYRKALTALNNLELDKAQRLFSQFIRNKPNLAGAYSNLALIHFKKNELDKSLKHVNRALKLNPNQTQALNIRAQLYIKNGKIHEAKEDYLKAIKIKPNYTNAQYNLALLYDIYLQEIALAVKHYKIYLSLQKEPDMLTQNWVIHLEGTLKNG